MATHSSVLAWRIPGMGEPGGLPSMGLHRGGHNWSDLAVAAAVGLSYMAFIMLRYISSMPGFWRVFIINWSWILSKAFSASIEIIMVFIFQFVNVVYQFYWFANIEKSLHPWNKAHLVIMYDLFNMSNNLIIKLFWKTCAMPNKTLALQIVCTLQ